MKITRGAGRWGFETTFSGPASRVIPFLIGALIGCAFFFGPTMGLYSDPVRSVSAPNHKGAK